MGLELSHSSLTVAVAGQGDKYGVDCLVFLIQGWVAARLEGSSSRLMSFPCALKHWTNKQLSARTRSCRQHSTAQHRQDSALQEAGPGPGQPRMLEITCLMIRLRRSHGT